MIRRIIIGLILCSWYCGANAQNNAIDQYNAFKKQARQEYDDFRKKCNEEYAEFLKQAWESYQAGPVIPKPEEKPVPPVVMPEEDITTPPEPKPLPIDEVITPVKDDEPQPKPVSPIYEKQKPSYNYQQFTFFGTNGKVRVPATKINLDFLNKSVSENNVSLAWEKLSDGDFDNLIRDCLEMRIKHDMSDWAYFMMLQKLSDAYYGKGTNAANMFLAWVYCQSGYQMKLGYNSNQLILLFASKHIIYDLSYYLIKGTYFYPMLPKGVVVPKNLYICSASFPNEKPLSLLINSAQSFAERYGNTRSITSKRYSNMTASVHINQNLMDFYATYPTSMIGDNFCSRWALYANTPMAKNVKEQLYPQLKNLIAGKSQLDAVNMLLNWVQTGFVYEYDDKVWGGDRAFFAEESLNYPYCDCEDRSILFTRLVRDLLGLKCLLIYYPGHLAAAVNFTQPVNGDYFNIKGAKYIVTDPTFIGAPVGHTMTGMDNKKANVIVLE